MSFFSRARARHERRIAIKSMLGMSDAELRDIGVSRHHLEQALFETGDPEIFRKIRERSFREMPY